MGYCGIAERTSERNLPLTDAIQDFRKTVACTGTIQQRSKYIMDEKEVYSSDVERAIKEATMENGWVNICDLAANTSSEEPTITGDEFLLTDNIITCKICQVSFSGIAPYEQHISGNKHKKKLTKEAMKKKYGSKYLEVLKSQETGTESTVETADGATGGGDDVYRCDICNKICTGLVSYKLHIKGKSHHKQLRKQNCIEKLQENSELKNCEKEVVENSVNNAMPQVKPFAHCEICEKKFSGPEGLQGHLSSASHKRKLEMQKLTEKLTGDDKKLGANDVSEQGFFARCQTCEKNLSGPIPYQQHLVSEVHQKKLKRLDLVEKMKSLSTNDGEEDTFHCKDCNRSFHIAEEFKQHLNSTYHNKKKVRQQMIEKLQKEYPEIEAQTTSANHDTTSGNTVHLLDDNIILICTICHKSFSGPEAACAHFTSQKHAKAKKQHLLLMQHRKVDIKDTD